MFGLRTEAAKMQLATVVCVIFCFASFAGAAELSWSRVESVDRVPPARSGTHMVYDRFDDSLYMFGGGTSDGLDRKMWKFDFSTRNWTVIHDDESTSPQGRKYAYYGLVRHGGDEGQSLFVISHGIGSQEYGDTWIFNTETRVWTELNANGPAPSVRYGGHYGVFNNTNEFWMGGGFTLTTDLATRYIDTYILTFGNTPIDATWTRVHDQPSIGNQFNPLVPHGRCLQGSAVVEEDKIVLWGGCMRGGTGGGPCPADDSWYFDNDDDKWTELPRCATPRVWSAMAPLSNSPGRAVLYGGSTDWSEQIISAVDWPEEEVLVVDVNEKKWNRYLINADSNDYPPRRFDHTMASGNDGVVYMFGGKRLSNSSFLDDLWMLSGGPDDTDTVSCDLGWVSIPHIHGLLMVFAFGILFPSGFFVARFFRCKGSKAWFIVHVIIQISAVITTIPAFIIIFYAGASPEPTHPHAIIGIILMFLMVIQPLNGIFRPHIKKSGEKSCYRIFWEWFHRIYGISVILIGLTQVSLGVFLIVPPRPVWIVWILVLFIWVVSYTVLEVIKCLCFVFRSDANESKDEIEMKNTHP